MEVLNSKEILKRTTIQSFDKRTIQILHQQNSKLSLAFLIPYSNKSTPTELIASLGFKPAIISPEYRRITPEYLNACHKEKMKVVVWTVNEKEQIEKMKLLGVDGIISDYPDRFK
jgi:glycerophosphoryl diester phosphodiesterase